MCTELQQRLQAQFTGDGEETKLAQIGKTDDMLRLLLLESRAKVKAGWFSCW